MCGRFTLSTPVEELTEQFEVTSKADVQPRFNIAPSEAIAAIRVVGDEPRRELALLRWGLVPSWAKELAVGNKMINARSETVATTPSFRTAFRRRRCLIPADGFYEWQRQEKQKQPFYIRMQDQGLFAFAGLWELWQGDDGKVVESCTILTTEPNELMQPLHNRMPVILAPVDYALWLDPQVQTPEQLQPLLRPYPADQMLAYPVTRLVNNPANDDPDCIVPMAA